MAQADPAVMTFSVGDYVTSKEIDWQSMFPHLLLGRHREPRKLADQIRKDVGKLKSISDAGRRAIQENRCAVAGITIDGTPCFSCFYIDRTRT